MSQIVKRYPIHQSPLYKLNSKKRLSSILKISIEQMLQLTNDDHYRVFSKDGREIQEPLGKRKQLHKRIKEILSRIECPEYLFSGVKKKSAIDNARYHLENKYAVTLDIKSFYRSSNVEYIFRFFHYVLMMEVDTARIISKILCYKDFIPTGSSSSQLLAYWSYSRLFDKINQTAQRYNIRFSLYVDDMTFSSHQPIPKYFDLCINNLLNTVALRIKKKKTKFYFRTDIKKVTGCIITANNELKVQNKHKKKIINLIGKFNSTSSNFEKEKIKRSLLGSITQAQQLEPSIFDKTKIQLISN